ncbi:MULTISPECIES: HTH-type transcriptional activator RhaR [Mangrovibacter]|uniref:HTH-type transcriptional activator RhaR n=1 Tax=Mangrovibacter plantisponsor TaxID=451513 RepID=A0A317PV87_9ENTR|nr:MULTISPECIES: HTH-type transcriptional activator RhaR [Mangrovibacter]KEA53027.1 transcriptional regulator [Mangrovibacter sp. MFB070]PWW06674.1 AraC family transcriptional regulator [Mangrovibacter plantisponsor]
MSCHLILKKNDFFTSATQPVVVADRYPQNVFAEHTHEFCELVLVWRGNGLHVLNDRPYRITCGDLFYVRAQDRHSYEVVNDLVLHNVIYCPERLTLNVNWGELLPGESATCSDPRWRLDSQGMALAKPLIDHLENETLRQEDNLSGYAVESLFLQLLVTLKRHRYQPAQTPNSGENLDFLMAALGQSLDSPFDLGEFCNRHQLSERALRQLFRQRTGMSISQYLRQQRLCHAQYLLRNTELLISDIATRCGFEDSNYFSVVFTRETGMTPRLWRQR